MVLSPDGATLYIIGWTEDVDFTQGSEDIILWAIDANTAKKLYASILGGAIHDFPGGIAATQHGTYMLGMSSTSDHLGEGNYDFVALELDYKMRNQCQKFNINRIGTTDEGVDLIQVGEVTLADWSFLELDQDLVGVTSSGM